MLLTAIMVLAMAVVANAQDEVGFTEYPIFEDEEVGFLNVSAVYFQPVPMSEGNENIEDFDIHLDDYTHIKAIFSKKKNYENK